MLRQVPKEIAPASSAQNMVATAQHDLQIVDDEWHTFSLDAACANRPRRIPGSGDSFSAERPAHAEELSRVAAALGRAVSFAVRQAAVWIVTDNASYSDLGTLVSRRAGSPRHHRSDGRLDLQHRSVGFFRELVASAPRSGYNVIT